MYNLIGPARNIIAPTDTVDTIIPTADGLQLANSFYGWPSWTPVGGADTVRLIHLDDGVDASAGAPNAP